ncbi:hypothetical protein CS063_04870 [Sporanaerobium hydrogeniformans]|uniref:Uncharacterized protein n=1 Tax=Sporanaerobium hydrogeniformans TaxID=3072179 RepID=A0AC61DE15_9FIRM|nr:class I SAM-dependent methyltransferase [Sporanaerobium hydrogeniformans]PHV71385.1 hypothetical protein CS063_04870 [Sporanaerobium hydrogeniformans]
MSRFSEYIGSQFGNPRGIVGKCCCIIMNIINKAMYRKVVSNIHLNEQAKVLDIGYGNGYLVEQLYKRYQANIFGIDISEDMKKSANKRNQRGVDGGKIHLSIGDCCYLNYENEFFDVVTSINTIYFWNDTLKGLKEIFRTLKSGGVFYNVVYTKVWLQQLSYTQKGFQFFEQEDFIEFGKQVGFTEITIQDIVKGKSFMVVYKK